jgi:hypothetical protein
MGSPALTVPTGAGGRLIGLPTEEIKMHLRVRLDELLPTKTAARTLPQALARLESGEAEQLVLTTRSQPRAVLITVERYEQLLGDRGGQARGLAA